ncbi:MAG: hypothetical protein WCT11_01385 [Candidatus Magasanikbacteria bacterium]
MPFERRHGTAIEAKDKPRVVTQHLDREGKVRLDLGPEKENIMLDIDEVITQFYRSKNRTALRGDRGTEKEYAANCRSATQDFGKMLVNQTDDDDKKFFERYPQAKYSDLENENPTKGAFAHFKFHSIGLLEIPDPANHNKGYYIAIDLTYSVAHADETTRTLVVHSNEKSSLLQELDKIYGSGPWTVYKLNPEKKTYVFSA